MDRAHLKQALKIVQHEDNLLKHIECFWRQSHRSYLDPVTIPTWNSLNDRYYL